jgi:hypothetical protein
MRRFNRATVSEFAIEMTDEYSRHRQTDADIPFEAELFHGHDRNDVCSLPASDRGRGGAADVVGDRREDVGTTCLLNPNWTQIEHVTRGWRHCGGEVDRKETATTCQSPQDGFSESIHGKKLVRLITA